MKGVILAGGTGSRLHPLTRITNKHLQPIYYRPMISYAIEALVTAGLSERRLITGARHAGWLQRLVSNGQAFCSILPRRRPSGRGERETTDVNNGYLEQAVTESGILEGFWGDAGEWMTAYYAANDFVRAHGANRED